MVISAAANAAGHPGCTLTPDRLALLSSMRWAQQSVNMQFSYCKKQLCGQPDAADGADRERATTSIRRNGQDPTSSTGRGTRHSTLRGHRRAVRKGAGGPHRYRTPLRGRPRTDGNRTGSGAARRPAKYRLVPPCPSVKITGCPDLVMRYRSTPEYRPPEEGRNTAYHAAGRRVGELPRRVSQGDQIPAVTSGTGRNTRPFDALLEGGRPAGRRADETGHVTRHGS